MNGEQQCESGQCELLHPMGSNGRARQRAGGWHVSSCSPPYGDGEQMKTAEETRGEGLYIAIFGYLCYRHLDDHAVRHRHVFNQCGIIRATADWVLS